MPNCVERVSKGWRGGWGRDYHEEEQAEREPGAAGDEAALVRVVLEREDDEVEQGAGEELLEELAGFGSADVAGWICGEDSGGGVGASDRADAVAFDGVDAVDVVSVDDGGGDEGTENLEEGVDWEPAPGHPAEDAAGECYSRAGILVSLNLV